MVWFHDVSCIARAEALFAKAVTVDAYDQRVLLLAGPDDHVVSTRPLEPAYLEYLASLGLGPKPAHVHVYRLTLDLAAGHTYADELSRQPGLLHDLAHSLRAAGASEVVVQPYVAHSHMLRWARALQAEVGMPVRVAGSLDAASRYVSKHAARELAVRVGLQVPAGHRVEGRPDEVREAVQELARACRRPLVVKSDHGCGGTEVWVIGPSGSLGTFGEWLSAQGSSNAHVLVVEDQVPVRCAMNVMVHVGDTADSIDILGTTDQRISRGTTHAGNIHPSTTRFPRELEAAARRLADAMRADGFRGYAGFDFVESSEADAAETALFFLEINPRVNAALFPLGVLQRMNDLQRRAGRPLARAFLQGYANTREPNFDACLRHLRPMLFDPATGRGAILYSPASLVRQALAYVILATSAVDAESIDAELTKTLAPPDYTK